MYQLTVRTKGNAFSRYCLLFTVMFFVMADLADALKVVPVHCHLFIMDVRRRDINLVMCDAANTISVLATLAHVEL